jgi:hypothetical protein
VVSACTEKRHHARLLADHLMPGDVSKLLTSSEEGTTTIREIVERLSISTTKVKRLLREHGGTAAQSGEESTALSVYVPCQDMEIVIGRSASYNLT